MTKVVDATSSGGYLVILALILSYHCDNICTCRTCYHCTVNCLSSSSPNPVIVVSAVRHLSTESVCGLSNGSQLVQLPVETTKTVSGCCRHCVPFWGIVTTL